MGRIIQYLKNTGRIEFFSDVDSVCQGVTLLAALVSREKHSVFEEEETKKV